MQNQSVKLVKKLELEKCFTLITVHQKELWRELNGCELGQNQFRNATKYVHLMIDLYFNPLSFGWESQLEIDIF